jgi:hypothetical protein
MLAGKVMIMTNGEGTGIKAVSDGEGNGLYGGKCPGEGSDQKTAEGNRQQCGEGAVGQKGGKDRGLTWMQS